MSRKLVLIVVFLMLYGSFAFLFAKPVVADLLPSDDFTIRTDGSIYPSTSLISTSDNVTYTLTGNITSNNDGIIIERNNTIIDGNGYSVQGSANGTGFWIGLLLSSVSNVTIRNTLITNFNCGIYLNSSSYITLSGNNVSANNQIGIHLESSSGNTVSGNNITNNYGFIVFDNSTPFTSGSGIDLRSSSNNSIAGNSIDNNYEYGISFGSSSNNTIAGNSITNNWFGIEFNYSSNNNIAGNVITENSIDGIRLESSYNNSISGNRITDNEGGIYLPFSSENSIFGNWITQNRWDDGIGLWFSSNNTVYHNNFVNNSEQVYDFGWLHYGSASSVSLLDNGFEGNYWSDYNGTDSNQDGIGDTPYIADANNIDHYPLMGTFQSFNVSVWNQNQTRYEEVEIISNSTVQSVELVVWLTSDNLHLKAGESFLWLKNVSSEQGTTSFCRIMIPSDVLNSTVYFAVSSNVTTLVALNATILPASNSTDTFLYLTYKNPINDVFVTIPEFPMFLVIPLFMIAASLAVIVYKRRHTTKA